MSNLLTDCEARGLIHSVTDRAELEKLLSGAPVTFYCGFDPTADSLHVGSLLPLLFMRKMANAGHKPICILGSGTGMIGDPSGRSEERNLLTVEQIEENIRGIRPQAEHIVGKNCELVSNLDWLGKLSMIEFLRDIGKSFSVNAMLTRDSVKSRLETRDEGLSYTEFSYMLLQAYDFLWLYEKKNCRLQIGGSDQWGNIVSGADLIRRKHPQKPPAFGLTIPLLLTSSGAKFGKTAAGNVWLNPKKTSPYRFYQFWLNTADDDVIRYLRLFTELPLDEVTALENSLKTSPEKRESQKKLAEVLTELVHGNGELKKAEAASAALFSGAVNGLSKEQLEDVFSEVPSATVQRELLSSGVPLVDLLLTAQAAKTKGDGRRLIEGGGCYINGEKITNPVTVVNNSSLLHNEMIIIRSGKKNFYVVRPI